jgi:hypothetical protein
MQAWRGPKTLGQVMVVRAAALALGFDQVSEQRTGALLRLLAASKSCVHLLEIEIEIGNGTVSGCPRHSASVRAGQGP